MLYIKFLHVLFVILWFAGLYTHSRLLVVQAASSTTLPLTRAVYQRMILPAGMIATTLGIYLAVVYFGYKGGWLHSKTLLVAALWAYQLWGKQIMIAQESGKATKSVAWLENFSRVLMVLLVLICFLVVVKPF